MFFFETRDLLRLMVCGQATSRILFFVKLCKLFSFFDQIAFFPPSSTKQFASGPKKILNQGHGNIWHYWLNQFCPLLFFSYVVGTIHKLREQFSISIFEARKNLQIKYLAQTFAIFEPKTPFYLICLSSL